MDFSSVEPAKCRSIARKPAANCVRLQKPIVRQLHEVTRGNPLFIDGILRAAKSEGGAERLRAGTFALSDDVRMVLQDRLHQVSPGTLEALNALSVIARPFSAPLPARHTSVRGSATTPG